MPPYPRGGTGRDAGAIWAILMDPLHGYPGTYAGKPHPVAFGEGPPGGLWNPEEVRQVPKGKEGPSIKKPDTYEALRDKGMSKERAAKISNAQANKQSKGKGKGKKKG